MEGMFADPIYGGNKNKAGWKMHRFSRSDPGARAKYRELQEQEISRRADSMRT